MILSLFAFRARQGLRWLVPATAFMFALGFLAVFSYTLGVLALLDSVRAEAPIILTLLGYLGDANLGVHVLGVLYGFVLPVIIVFTSVSLGRRLIGQPLDDGRMAILLAAGYRRASVILTLCLVMLFFHFLLLLSCFLGQAAAAAIFFSGFDVLSLLRLTIGFLLVSLPFPALAALFSARAEGARRALRRGFIIMLVLVGGMAASRLSGFSTYLRFVTPFTLFEGQKLLAGGDGWMMALWALPFTAGLLVWTALVFRGREL